MNNGEYVSQRLGGMCRFVIYKGTSPVQLSHLLTRPCHSIINQAFDSRLRLDHRRPINGDGFGVGWYDTIRDEELGSQPCFFTSVTPAWNNANLARLAEKIKSPLVFAHVRATTAGSLSLDNCHPFVFGKIMFMHNGGIADFHLIKRRLQSGLSDEIFNTIQGNTGLIILPMSCGYVFISLRFGMGICVISVEAP
ncbi:nucleophile aminohydrolase [Scleroderma yunnanense]